MNFLHKKSIKLLINRFDLELIKSIKMDVIFVDGMFLKEGNFNEGKPHLKLSIKVADFAKFVKDNTKEGWLNLEIKTSKGGKTYVCLDTWVPEPKEGATESNDDLPF